jgi:type II secretory pathway component PulC
MGFKIDDKVLSINGKSFCNAKEMQSLMQKGFAIKKLKFTLERNGKKDKLNFNF